jgi:hypothetical protein
MKGSDFFFEGLVQHFQGLGFRFRSFSVILYVFFVFKDISGSSDACHTRTHSQTRTHTHTLANTHAHTLANTHARTHAHTHKRTHMYIIKKHTYIYIQNIYTHPINIHTSKHIHIICTHMCSVSEIPCRAHSRRPRGPTAPGQPRAC